MSVPREKGKAKRPAVGKSPEVGGSSAPEDGPQKYDGRARLHAGTKPDSPFVEYWKTPAKVLRKYGGND